MSEEGPARKAGARLAAPAPAPAESPPRGRGRPRIGEPKTVRLPEEEEVFTLVLGQGSFPEGVRVAVRQVRMLGRPLDLADAEIAALLRRTGEASLAAALEVALRGKLHKTAPAPAEEVVRGLLDTSLSRFASQLGEGDLLAGLARAVRVCSVLGLSTALKLDDAADRSKEN